MMNHTMDCPMDCPCVDTPGEFWFDNLEVVEDIDPPRITLEVE